MVKSSHFVSSVIRHGDWVIYQLDSKKAAEVFAYYLTTQGFKTHFHGYPYQVYVNKNLVVPKDVIRRAYRTARHYAPRTTSRRDPDVGEVYESRSGKRWQIVSEDGERVRVKPAGVRETGELPWGKSVLKGMKRVTLKTGETAMALPASVIVPPQPKQEDKGFFSTILGDPGKRKRKRGFATKRCRTSTVVQTLVFSRRTWTLARAKAWVRDHRGFRSTRVDVTPSSYRFRQVSPRSVRIVGGMEFRRGLRAILGCPR